LLLYTQAIFPGLLESTYRRELQNLFSKNVLARLWAKGTSLWPAEDYQAESMESNLSWLDLPEQLGPLLARMVARAAKIEPAGFEDVVFVTMGVSSLAAENILPLPAASRGKRTFLLDTIDPDSVRAFDGMLDFGTTLFVFANKSGKPIETHSLLLYFLERLKMMGIHSPAHHFITLTEENSYLGQLAGEYDFLDSFLDPPGIHGRYSSLIHFNFFLAALCRLDPSDLLARTQSMRDACGPSPPEEANPAASLGAFLAAEIEGLDRLVFFSTDSLKSVARRIGYLVGASTGKRGHGIVPIFGQPSYRLEMLQELTRRHDELRGAGVPMVTIELNGPEELAVELFKMGDCDRAGLFAARGRSLPRSRHPGKQVEDHADIGADRGQASISCTRHARSRRRNRAICRGRNSQQISALNMTEALRTFFGLRHPQAISRCCPLWALGRPPKSYSAGFVTGSKPLWACRCR
jgi:transaldolase / glucose-6-phosphate isomerase